MAAELSSYSAADRACDNARSQRRAIGSAASTPIAIEPVGWPLGVARRFEVSEVGLRRALFELVGTQGRGLE